MQNEKLQANGMEWLVDGVLPRAGVVIVAAPGGAALPVAMDIGFSLDESCVDPTWGGRAVARGGRVLLRRRDGRGEWLVNPPGEKPPQSTATAGDLRALIEMVSTAENVSAIVLDGVRALDGTDDVLRPQVVEVLHTLADGLGFAVVLAYSAATEEAAPVHRATASLDAGLLASVDAVLCAVSPNAESPGKIVVMRYGLPSSRFRYVTRRDEECTEDTIDDIWEATLRDAA